MSEGSYGRAVNNTIISSGNDAIVVGGFGVAEGNFINLCSGKSIKLGQSGSATGNTIRDAKGDGIVGTTYSAIVGNTIEDTDTGFADIKQTGDYASITGNTCRGAGDSDIGIYLDEADQCVVTGNATSNHDTAGIQEDSDCQDNMIYGNNCQDTTPYVQNGFNGTMSITSTDAVVSVGAIVGRVSIISGDGNTCYIPVYAGS